MNPSSMTRPLAAFAMFGVMAAGCGEDPEFQPTPLSVTAGWDSAAPDLTLAYLMETPTATQRLLARPNLCASRKGVVITGISRDGTGIAFESNSAFFGESCARILLGEVAVQGGDVLRVTLEDPEDGPTTVETVIPALPLESAFHALAAVRATDGTTWLATPHHGLVGVTSDGRVVDYAGVASADLWDPAAQEPQSGLVLTIEKAVGRALWVSSAVTGISWFDPGADATLLADDKWVHGQPTASPPLAAELAQTAVAIAPDPTDANGLWVASLNGLYHARKVGDVIDFVRIADGFAVSVSVDPYGRVWCGFTTQPTITVADENDDVAGGFVTLSPSPGALLVLTPGADPHVAADADLRWALPDEDAVTAILTDSTGAWVGTPYGISRVSDDALELEAVPAVVLGDDLAVVDLEATNDGFWLAARGECTLDEGRLLRVQLDERGGVEAVVDHSDAAFGERDFAWVKTLPSGELLVSTLVPVPHGLTGGEAPTARGCDMPPASERSADLYVLSPDGHARRFGTAF